MVGSEPLVAAWRAGRISDAALLDALRTSPRTLPSDPREVPPIVGAGTALLIATLAAIGVQVALALVDAGGDEGAAADATWWLVRHAPFLILPFVAALLLVRRRVGLGRTLLSATPFLVALVVVDGYPLTADSSTGLLVVTHLPVLLWAMLGVARAQGRMPTREHRLDLVRFSGRWAVTMALFALAGGVLVALTLLVLAPTGVDVDRLAGEWLIPSGFAGAAVVAAWLVEERPDIVDQIVPMLTAVFLPLFATMIVVATVLHAATAIDATFDRDLLLVLDALMVVVVALVLYSTVSVGEAAPRWLRWTSVVAVLGALTLDLLVLATMLGRIAALGLTPNRVAVVGLNVVLLVTLAGIAWWSVRALLGRAPQERLRRWLADALVLHVAWLAAVVLVLPPLFRWR
jgi:hypothetical protein